MALPPGTRLGPYEVLAPIGAGGMGEVYKGRDTRLNRDVAIKVLPEHLALNAEVRERFQREAETIANLNHPNICTLYDIGEKDGTQFLVMEYLEGETVAQRLLKGPLPLDQVLKYAIEISDALDKAHRKEITHRDIKPGNIMLVKSGSGQSTKLLDFGLAKLKQAIKPIPLGPDDPTPPIGKPTIEGTILGTVQYMSPEQAEGKIDDIDGRSDIFSFGATVYEMLTGKKAFEGKSTASVMAQIFRHEPPPVSSLEPVTPSSVDYVVKICLAKEPDDRWQTARDLCRELRRIKESGSQPSVSQTSSDPAALAAPQLASRRTRERLAWAVASLVLLVAGWLAGNHFRNTAPAEAPLVKTTVLPPENATVLPDNIPLISPDGRQLAFLARDTSGKTQIWVRPLDSLQAQPLRGTDGAYQPSWSPDSRSLAFFAERKLKKIDITGRHRNCLEPRRHYSVHPG
jgi:serine/threonine protein kinase